MRAADGKQATDSIRGFDSTGEHIALIAAHQLIHIEVAAARIALPAVAGVAIRQPAIDSVIPCGAVVRVNGALIEVGAIGIIVCPGIGVHCVVPSQKPVAVGKVVLEHPIRFTGQIRFLIAAHAPAHAVNAIVALGVHHISLRVRVKAVTIHDIRLDVHILGVARRVAVVVLFQQPAVGGGIAEEALIHGLSIRHIRIQEGNRPLVPRARGGLDIVAILIRRQLGVGWDVDSRAGAARAAHTKIYSFTVPLRICFKRAIS